MKKVFASWKFIVLAISLIIITLIPLYSHKIIFNITLGIIGVFEIIIITAWYIIAGRKTDNEHKN